MPRGEFDRSPRRARTRALLLEAAGRVYARRGFDNATLDEIADEAGFTKGAVYDHFGSKEKLLMSLLDEHLAEQIAEQIEVFDPSSSPTERPWAGAGRWMRDLENNPDAFRLLVEAWVHGQRDDDILGRVAEGMGAWRETLQSFGRARARELGMPDADLLLEQTSTVIVALGIGLAMVKLADPELVAPELLGAVTSILLLVIESSPEAREFLAALT
jgi:AcrR family transcriptional regulator